MMIDEDVLKKYLSKAQGFEVDLNAEKDKSRRNAWICAGAGVLVGVIGVAAAAFQAKNYRVDVFQTIVNAQTGYVETVRVDENAPTPKYDAKTQDAIDRHWIASYILKREGYNWQTLQESHDTVMLMSAPDVAAEYDKGFGEPNGIDVVNKDNVNWKITINSISFLPNAVSVEFTKEIKPRNGAFVPTEHWVATLTYKYGQIPKNPVDRVRDPMGFVVTSYGKDPVTVSTTKGATLNPGSAQ